MAAALACDPSVITGIDQSPIDIPVDTASMTAPAPTPVAAAQAAIPTTASVTAPATPAIDVTHLPTIQEMVNELRTCGILQAQTTLPPPAVAQATTQEVQVFPPVTPVVDPTQNILLANTAPSYVRPTAANLLSQASQVQDSGPSPLLWLIPVSFLCLLGAAGVMMYIQMRSTGTIQLPQLLHF